MESEIGRKKRQAHFYCCLIALSLCCQSTLSQQSVKIGAIVSKDWTEVNEEMVFRAVQEFSSLWTTRNFSFDVVSFKVKETDSAASIQNIVCRMVDEGVIAVVSAIEDSKQSCFFVDMFHAVNLLHILPITHMYYNSYQRMKYGANPFTPVIYADFHYKQLYQLLFDYLNKENFRWRRTVIVYELMTGLEALYEFIDRLRQADRRITAIELPTVEDDDGFDEDWRNEVDRSVLNSSAIVQERYFIIHANFDYTEAFVQQVVRSKMTRSSYFYLITNPTTVEQEQKILLMFEDKIEKPHVFFIHRHDPFRPKSFEKAIRSSVNFAFKLTMNYSSAVADANYWSLWPLRPHRLGITSTCNRTKRSLRDVVPPENFSRVFDGIVDQQIVPANSSICPDCNHFQSLFDANRPENLTINLIEVDWVGKTRVPKIVFPCENCFSDLDRSSIRVAAYLDEPCIMPNKRIGERNKPFDGFCVELLEAVAKDLKVELLWSSVPDNVTGRLDDDYGWNGVIKMLIDKNADISGNLIEIDSLRAKYIEFSDPVLQTHFEALMKQKSNATPKLMAFMKPFKQKLWAATMAVIILSSTCFWAFTKVLNWPSCATEDSSQGSVPRQPHSIAFSPTASVYRRRGWIVVRTVHNLTPEEVSFGHFVWYTVSIFFKKNFDRQTRLASIKMLSSFLAFLAVILVASYTANLAAILATEWRTLEISTIDQLSLSQKTLRILDSSATGAFLKRSKKDPTYGRIWNTVKGYPKEAGFVRNSSTGISMAKNGDAVWIGDSSTIEYWLAKRECAEPNSMSIIGKFGSNALAFAFQKNSPVRDKFTSALLQVMESGRMRRLRHEWYNPPTECDSQIALIKEKSRRKADKMTIQSLSGVLFLLVCGIAVAVFLIIIKSCRLYLMKEHLKMLKMMRRKRWTHAI